MLSDVAVEAAYVIGGLVTAAAGFLPGNRVAFRVLCVAGGLGLAGWTAKVMLSGGWLFVNAFVLIVPAVLMLNAVLGAVRSRPVRRTPAPLPMTRTYTELGTATPVFEPRVRVSPVLQETRGRHSA